MDDVLAAGMELAGRAQSSPGRHRREARRLPEDGSSDEAGMDDVLEAGTELAERARSYTHVGSEASWRGERGVMAQPACASKGTTRI